jgi:hypothetical protein
VSTKPATAEHIAATQSAPMPKPKHPAKSSPTVSFSKALAQTDPDARRKAAAILEVLAGVRRPSDAAQALGINGMRYYLLEMRAIQGLVKACEPAKLGPKASPDREVQRLRKQVATLERECARYAALARVAQRAFNLSPPSADKKTATGKRVRRCKPPIRAVKLLARVKASLDSTAVAEQPAPAPASNVSTLAG